MKKIFLEIARERQRQDKKWGQQNHPSIDPLLKNRGSERICEEYEIPTDQRAKFLCQNAANNDECTWAHIIVEELSEAVCANNEADRREELVQLAACVVSWIQSLDRNEKLTNKNK